MNKNNKNKKRMTVFLLCILIVILLSNIVAAQFFSKVSSGIKNTGSRISNSGVGQYFQKYAATDKPTFLDFFLFAVLFFAMSWIAFNKFFQDAGKGPVIAMSVAIGLGLAAALVWGGKFTIKKLLPFALVFLGIAIFIVIYVLLSRFVFKGETAGSKAGAAIIALIITGILMFFMISAVCNNNRCNTSPILSKVFGPNSMFGKIGGWFGNIGGGGYTPTPTPRPQPKPPTPTPTPTMDLGTIPAKTMSTSKKVGIGIGILLIIGAIALIPWMIRKHREGKKKMMPGSEEEKGLYIKFNEILDHLTKSDEVIKEDFHKAKSELKQESEKFSKEKELAEGLKDIDETIGGEVEKIQEDIKEGLDFHELQQHNRAEITHVTKIMDRLNRDKHLLETLEIDLDKINESLERLEEADNVFDSMKKAGLESTERLEHSEIEKMKGELATLTQAFQEFSERCQLMSQILESGNVNLQELKKGKIKDYDELIQKVMHLRTHFSHLNTIFAEKVGLFRQIAQYLEELDEEIKKINDDEYKKLSEFKKIMDEKFAADQFDTALHFADLVKDNADIHIKYEEHDKAVKHEDWTPEEEARLQKLKDLKKAAEDMFNDCKKKVHPDKFMKSLNKLKDATSIADLEEAEEINNHAFESSEESHKPLYALFAESQNDLRNSLKRVELWHDLNNKRAAPRSREQVLAFLDQEEITKFLKHTGEAIRVGGPTLKDKIDKVKEDDESEIAKKAIPVFEHIADRIEAEKEIYKRAEIAIKKWLTDKDESLSLMTDIVKDAESLPKDGFHKELAELLQTMNLVKRVETMPETPEEPDEPTE
ncbi:hypothetical protein ACFL0V_04215 [Nanoarchaeota archaeon]